MSSSSSYDPKEKKNHGTPLWKSIVKIFVTVGMCKGALVAFRMQQQNMAVQIAQSTTTEAAAAAAVIPSANNGEAIIQKQSSVIQERTEEDSTTSSAANANVNREAAPITKSLDTTPEKETVITPPADNKSPNNKNNKPTSPPGLKFSRDKPVLVLSLPHNGELAVARYFKCGGVTSEQMGRYWSTHAQVPLGRCLQSHLDEKTTTPITHNCGANFFTVWSELHMIEPAKTKGKYKHEPRCFDPVLFPNALAKLHEAIPNAYVLVVKQSFGNWYQSMPKDLKAHWKKYCNPTHNDAFPSNSHSKTQFAQFYTEYHDKIRTFVENTQGSWQLMEMDLDQDSTSMVGTKLEDLLGIPWKCWVDSVDAPLKTPAASTTTTTQQLQKMPNTIPYPILSVALPKGGDGMAFNYFQCGLGLWATVQQWTTPSKSTLEHPLPDTPIGKCIEENMSIHKNNNILKGCGHARVWGDIGYLRDKTNGGHCFYPTLTEGVLEQFVQYYPRATILHVVRPAQEWYNSALKNNNLPARWSKAVNCPGFPSEEATPDDWYEFYDQHAQTIRNFAAQNSNITYLEIPLSQKGGELLQNIFEFPSHCSWSEGSLKDQR